MSLRFDRNDALSLGAIAGALLLTGVLYERLPPEVPVHFNLHGVADGWMARSAGAWLLPGIALGVLALVRLGALALPPAWRGRLEASPVSAVALMVTALLVALHIAVLYVALHPGVAIGGALAVGLGVFWILLAQLLPRVRRNPFIGIRTAWTLTSDENWLRTHRLGAWTFTAGGVASVVFGLLGVHSLALLALVVTASLPVIYSYLLARRLPPSV